MKKLILLICLLLSVLLITAAGAETAASVSFAKVSFEVRRENFFAGSMDAVAS